MAFIGSLSNLGVSDLLMYAMTVLRESRWVDLVSMLGNSLIDLYS